MTREKAIFYALGVASAVVLTGCTGSEVLAGLGAIGGLFIANKKLNHPVSAAITENPAMFWQTVLAVVGLCTALVGLAHKAGKDKNGN